MNTAEKRSQMLVFLVDADNLCAPASVEEGFRKLEEAEGSISVRRAYGSAEKLKGVADVLRSRLVRPFVNLALSKNTTDVALAIDAMELSYLTPRPDAIAIGSGDADFVPLVLRLRERGFRMICVSEKGKMASEAIYAYDQVVFVGKEHPSSASHPTPSVPEKLRLAPMATPVSVDSTKTAAAKKVAAKKVPAKKVAAKKTTPAKPGGDTAGKITYEQILSAAPALKAGQLQSLGEVVKLLHDKKVLAKSASSTALFKKFPFHFELSPQKQPNQVRYILPPDVRCP